MWAGLGALVLEGRIVRHQLEGEEDERKAVLADGGGEPTGRRKTFGVGRDDSEDVALEVVPRHTELDADAVEIVAQSLRRL